MVDVVSERGRQAETLDYILDMMSQLAVLARGANEEDLALILRAAVGARRGRGERLSHARRRLGKSV